MSGLMRFPDNAERNLLRLLEAEWELYDGVEIQRDDELALFDILLSIMVNSRLDTAEKVRSIWKSKRVVELALTRVPAAARLEDEYIAWDSLTSVLDAFCGIKYAGPAVATKILHKKRPELIPILDSVLCAYYNTRLKERPKWGASMGQRLVEYLKVFRDDLLEYRGEVGRLCGLAREKGWPISPVRALELLVWIETEPNGYYR